MKRLDPRNFIVLALVGLSGAVLLHVSQNVQKSEDKLAEIEASIDREQETIRVLRAEWAYLNRPDRLERLAHEFLDLVPPEAEDVAATPSYLPERVQEDDVSSPSASPSLIEAQPIAFGASEEPSGDAGAIRPRPKPSFSKKRTYLREPSDAAERPTKNFQSLLDELGGGGFAMIFGASLHYRRSRYHAFKFDGERSSALEMAHGRLVLMSAFFVLFYSVLAIRAFDLSVIQALPHDLDMGAVQGHLEAQAQFSGDVLVPPHMLRADITDRNGVLLATTLKTASLYADTHLISDAKATAEGLITIFPELSYGAVLEKLQSGKRFIWLKRNITPDEEYAVLELGQPGLQFRREERRFYPQGALAAHLVGYTDVDAQGLAGVERSFDNYLNEGRPLALTIDIRLQHALRREVKRAVEEFSASSASGVIMDVKTGEILAGVSLPDFDPHDPGGAPKEALFSHLTQGAYELGSVFKVFSTAALFESRNVPMGTMFDAREPLKRGRYTINDYHAKDRILTLPEVFMYSSNIGSAMMGEAVGTDALKAFYEDLGLLTPLELEIRETAHPIVPSPWRDINALTASYGHGVATTPVQLVTAVSSIVNGGLLVKPSVVLHDATAQTPDSSAHIRVVSERTAEKMRELLRLVVTDGTGSKADVKGYQVGGKTGTAEKLVNGRYDRTKRMSSFVGVFPMDAPRYAVFVIVDEPKGNKDSFGYATGGWVAAPAVARTVVSMAAILGLPPESPSRLDPASPLKQYISTAGD